jgi:hypothetical protein
MLPVQNGQPLIGRTIDQVKEHYPIYVATWKPSIKALALKMNVYPVNPLMKACTCETLWSLQALWQKRVTVLLGDVWYTRACLEQVFTAKERFEVFGNSAEVFALSFVAHDEFEDALWKTIEIADAGGCQGKLRNLYHTYCGLPYKWAGAEQHDPNVWRLVLSEIFSTQDIDKPEQYRRLKKRCGF